MPYIKKERRIPRDKRGYTANGVGELNYAISRLCDLYLEDYGEDYRNINAVIGALECAKLEFYRRIAAPYEDTKLAENGDVYHGGHSDNGEPSVYVDRDGDVWYWQPEHKDANGADWHCRYHGEDIYASLDVMRRLYGPLTSLP